METQTKAKKNLDYSASAVNLTNATEVKMLVDRLHDAFARANDIQAKIDAAIPPELTTAKEAEAKVIDMLFADIRASIEAHGSYQDTVTGSYAIKQRKVSVTYDPIQFEKYYPQYAPAIIMKAIDTIKLKGLIKGGLISQEVLEDSEIAKETESFVYIIK